MNKLRKFLLGSLVLVIPLIAYASNSVAIPNAKDVGTKGEMTTKTPEVALASYNKNGWCLISDTDNADNFNFTLGATATSTVGIEMQPGDFFCAPIAGESAYTGVVYVAAQTTTATITYYTLAY